MTRPSAVALFALALALGARAQERARPEEWALEAPLVQDAAIGPSLPGGDVHVMVSLWLPIGADERAPGAARYIDALFRAAAILQGPPAACVITLGGVLDPTRERPLRWEEATLGLPDGAALRLTEEAFAGQPRGLQSNLQDGKRVVRYQLPFPALPAAAHELVLCVPLAAEGEPPFELRFFRWKERMARAEAALLAWREHTRKPEVQAASATGAWIECAGERDLLACGEQAAVPLLLRELHAAAQGKPGEAIPHFALLPVLAGTDWGKREGIPSAGTPQDAAHIVRSWADRGHPAAPGVTPPR